MESFGSLKGCGPPTAEETRSFTAVSAPEEGQGPPPKTENVDNVDEGPFFDLEFAVPGDNVVVGEEEGEGDEMEEEEEVKEFNFTMASSEESDFQSMSPSDDIFFKGSLVPLEQNGVSVAEEERFPKSHTAASLLKSATRFRVFMLGLRKPKCMAAEHNAIALPKQSNFFIKFKVEEVPIVSLFSRDGSGRSQAGGTFPSSEDSGVTPPSTTEEKSSLASLNSKEVVNKYLSKIKPLYVRVSKRYVEKLRFSGHLVAGELPVAEQSAGDEKEETVVSVAEKSEKDGEKMQKLAMPARLRVVYELLGKLKSSSSATVAAVSPQQRRDDSLIQQQDGIQSAIAHCKKSFAADSKGTNKSKSIKKETGMNPLSPPFALTHAINSFSRRQIGVVAVEGNSGMSAYSRRKKESFPFTF